MTAIATIITKKSVDVWRDSDEQLFSTRLHDMLARFNAFDALVTSELKMVTKSKGSEVRFLSMMKADGAMPSKVLRVKTEKLDRMKAVLEELDQQVNDQEMEALFLLISDRLLADE